MCIRDSTKSLSFNIYDVCYAASEDERRRYIEYIDEEYNADRLTQILTDVAEIIGANILNIARQDYDPQGASVTILISEQPVVDKADAKGVISDAVVAHLDKSHITVHTYPGTHPDNGIATFRAVSYTHLDVYKRQVHHWSVRCGRHRRRGRGVRPP